MLRLAPPSLLLVLAIAACRADPPPPPDARRDPAVAQALDDPLMTDPDLSSRNEGAAAITIRTDGGLPVIPVRAEEIAAARAEAATMTGGAARLPAVPRATGRVPPLAPRHGPADHLKVLADKTACRATLTESTIWAARLPEALPVYPRGAALAATGGEGKGCRVAAVAFTTPVPLEEVLAFYWQRATAAGLAPMHRATRGGSVLQGQGHGTAFDLRASRTGEQTTVELATVTG
jgi:hypothetical protein